MTINRITGRGEIKILTIALGWSTAEFLLSR